MSPDSSTTSRPRSLEVVVVPYVVRAVVAVTCDACTVVCVACVCAVRV